MIDRISRFIKELQDRRVFRIASVYVVSMWIVVQGAIDLFPLFGIPDWSIRLLVIAAAAGLPVAVVLAWAYQVTPDGVVRDDKGEITDKPKGGWRFDVVAIGALVVLVLFVLLRSQFPDRPLADASDGEEIAAVAEPGSSETLYPSAQLDEAVPPHPQSIAVLPFVNMSSDEDTEYFSDGITEELLNVLANIPGLRVASRTSAFAFKDTRASIPEVSQALNVAYVLEGSVRRSQNQIRITAQLINARDDIHLWSKTYDREMLEIFAIQDEISGAIVDQLRPTLLASRGGNQQPASITENVSAYDLYLRGRASFAPGDADAIESSISYLRQSLVLDDQFARSHSALARALLASSELADSGGELKTEAMSEAKTALRLDNRLREAHEILRSQQP